MRSRFHAAWVVLFLIGALGGFWYFYTLSKTKPGQRFPATVRRDCAPWDGAAFTLSIQYDQVTTLTLSIWQPPEIRHPVTFSFPDETGQVGYAFSLVEAGPLEELSGEVTFERVGEGLPLDGRFSFTSAGGGRYEGQFAAQWEHEAVYCG